mmetsp:Transcript_35209/g.65578  ORF Transcript_35209/g.65578 Transcript_35209/m.65578 type:complete len:233 (+) Transcript_35209:100-798(+)
MAEAAQLLDRKSSLKVRKPKVKQGQGQREAWLNLRDRRLLVSAARKPYISSSIVCNSFRFLFDIDNSAAISSTNVSVSCCKFTCVSRTSWISKSRYALWSSASWCSLCILSTVPSNSVARPCRCSISLQASTLLDSSKDFSSSSSSHFRASMAACSSASRSCHAWRSWEAAVCCADRSASSRCFSSVRTSASTRKRSISRSSWARRCPCSSACCLSSCFSLSISERCLAMSD